MPTKSVSETIGGRVRCIKNGSITALKYNVPGIGTVQPLSPVTDPFCGGGCKYCEVSLGSKRTGAKYLSKENISTVARIINKMKPDALWVMEKAEVGLNRRAMEMVIELRRLIDPSITFIISTKFLHKIYHKLEGNYLVLVSLSNPCCIKGLEKGTVGVKERIRNAQEIYGHLLKKNVKVGFRVLIGQKADIKAYEDLLNDLPTRLKRFLIIDFMRKPFYKTKKGTLRRAIRNYLPEDEYTYISDKYSFTGETLRQSIYEEAIRVFERITPRALLDRIPDDYIKAISPKLRIISKASPIECYLVPGVDCIGKACGNKRSSVCYGIMKNGKLCPTFRNGIPYDLYYNAVALWLGLRSKCENVAKRRKQPFAGKKRIEKALDILLDKLNYLEDLKEVIEDRSVNRNK